MKWTKQSKKPRPYIFSRRANDSSLPAALAEDIGAAFVVRDHNGQQLAYVYYEEEPGRRSSAKLLTKDEARRIAANIAKLPELLTKPRVVSAPKRKRPSR
jgi:hypothetical protein